MKHASFQVVVIGGGHAGLEAALAAARSGTETLLLTLNLSDIGVMSCNPAMGGVGKGHLVREVDALDGAMGRLADASGIQFRLLNRKKGPAVRGPRAQIDREAYKANAKRLITGYPSLTIAEGEAARLLFSGEKIKGVRLADGTEIDANAVILTAGTFLRGVIHIGHAGKQGGRIGSRASVALAESLSELGLPVGRLKTGTPPRILRDSINWDILERQDGDGNPEFLSFLTQEVSLQQISCGITHTNPETHDIILENLYKSAMYGGEIQGNGPRYCPSIEDKVTRFKGKESHQVFLEPEGLQSDLIYPNGISTSLPLEIQERYVRSITGLENAKIEQPGYAIEYDYFDPRSLTRGLQVRNFPGLFFAGQINGTTGYEEAAAQGLVAGINAARYATGREEVTFSRTESYIGVMIDDLTTLGVTEPYRMFTSRAEFRLSLRADNADQRLTPLGIELGVVSKEREEKFRQKQKLLKTAKKTLQAKTFPARAVCDMGVRIKSEGPARTALEILALPGASFSALSHMDAEIAEIPEQIAEQLAIEALYENYMTRQNIDAARLKKEESLEIPKEFEFRGISGLSNELVEKLEKTRPSTISHAGRIEGMTPAALTLILARLRAFERAN